MYGCAAKDLRQMLDTATPEQHIREVEASLTNPLVDAVPGQKLGAFDEGNFELGNRFQNNGVCWALRVALDPDSPGASSEIHSSILVNSEGFGFPPLVKSLVYLPGGAVEGDDDGKSLFHLDASGATAFSAPEAARASEYLASSRFLDAVKRSLQTKRFELPQQSAAVSAHFCNESVYGNLNVLCVTGVVRLDPNADVGGDDATPVTLDWPSEATRAAAKRARKKLLKGPANYPGPWND